MQMYPRRFPPTRRRMPTRRAEKQVYEALAGSGREGFVYYEWRRDYRHIELDFALWASDWGRIALQVKGGNYRLTGGDWCLRTRKGLQLVDHSPLDEAWLASLDLNDAIKELAQTTYRPFVIPVLVFPDMVEPDSDIENLARRKKVHVIWGVENLVTDLSAIARGRGRSGRLSADRIDREVFAVTDGLLRFDRTELKGRSGETVQARGKADTRPKSILMGVSVGGFDVARLTIRQMRAVPGDSKGREPSRPA